MAVPVSVPGTTILVVDDERVVRRIAYRILSGEGYRVFEAGNAEEAVGVLDLAHRYVHLVVLDVVMPVVDGVALGRRILARWPALTLLYMSAYPADVLAAYGLSDLRPQFLAKPFTPAELLGQVQEALQRPATVAAWGDGAAQGV